MLDKKFYVHAFASLFFYFGLVCFPYRQLNLQSAPLPPTRAQSDKMSVAQLRALSATHWKILSHLRDYLTKPSENGYVFNLTKEWMALLQKLPSLQPFRAAEKTLKNESVHSMSTSSFSPTSGIVDQVDSGIASSTLNTNNKPPGNSATPPTSSATTADAPSSKYSQVFANMKLFGGNGSNGKGNGEVVQEKSKWRTEKEVVSKVSRLSCLFIQILNILPS